MQSAFFLTNTHTCSSYQLPLKGSLSGLAILNRQVQRTLHTPTIGSAKYYSAVCHKNCRHLKQNAARPPSRESSQLESRGDMYKCRDVKCGASNIFHHDRLLWSIVQCGRNNAATVNAPCSKKKEEKKKNKRRGLPRETDAVPRLHHRRRRERSVACGFYLRQRVSLLTVTLTSQRYGNRAFSFLYLLQ